jgi:hypothetical protein
LLVGARGGVEQLELGGERALAAQRVDRTVAGGRDQPAERVGGLTVARPS